jgi:hypothetical protein
MQEMLKHARGLREGKAARDPASVQKERVVVVYVLQVIAQHGYGLEGWRTVRKPSGEPYSFETRAAAQAALQQHFGNLRDGVNVRVHAMDTEAAQRAIPAVQRDPTSSSAPVPPHRPADPFP